MISKPTRKYEITCKIKLGIEDAATTVKQFLNIKILVIYGI